MRSIKKGRSYSSSSSPRLRHRSRRHHSPLALSRRSRRSSSSSSSYRPKSRSRPRELDSAIQVLRKKLQKLELEYVDATETEGNTARLQRMVDKLQAQLQAASQEYASALAAKRERQARRGITPAQITQVTREALAATAAAAPLLAAAAPVPPAALQASALATSAMNVLAAAPNPTPAQAAVIELKVQAAEAAAAQAVLQNPAASTAAVAVAEATLQKTDAVLAEAVLQNPNATPAQLAAVETLQKTDALLADAPVTADLAAARALSPKSSARSPMGPLTREDMQLRNLKENDDKYAAALEAAAQNRKDLQEKNAAARAALYNAVAVPLHTAVTAPLDRLKMVGNYAVAGKHLAASYATRLRRAAGQYVMGA